MPLDGDFVGACGREAFATDRNEDADEAGFMVLLFFVAGDNLPLPWLRGAERAPGNFYG